MSHYAAEATRPVLSLAERGYRNLVNALADQEPRYGYLTVDQLPELTDLEVATVLKHRDDLLANAAVGLGERVASFLADSDDRGRLELIGLQIVTAVRKEARAHLLSDVQEECSKRELAQLADADDEAREQRFRRNDSRTDAQLAMADAGVPAELRR